MDYKELDRLQTELLNYVADVGIGKDFDKLRPAIRERIDSLNILIDELIDEGEPEVYFTITHICYQYYRLLFG